MKKQIEKTSKKEEKLEKKPKSSKKSKSLRKSESLTQEYEKDVSKEPKKRKRKPVSSDSLIPSGCTVFNLKCSDRIEGAFQLGKYHNVIGDSSSGKTILCLHLLAECANDKRFDEYRLIKSDCEQADEFDIKFMFGKKTAKRIEHWEDQAPETVEEFSDQINKLLEEEKPFIYILDSLDSLTSKAEVEKEEKNRKKREKGTKEEGSYDTDKQKYMSKFFRTTRKKLNKHNSAVIIISQTRDNIGFGAFLNPKSRSGGRALKFYSCIEVWGSVGKKEKEGQYTTLTETAWKITKNKTTGRHATCYFNIIQDYGIDDIGACIRFLIEEGSWSASSKASINVKNFANIEKNISYKELVKKIEKDNLEDDLRNLCQIEYNKILEKIAPERKQRYE